MTVRLLIVGALVIGMAALAGVRTTATAAASQASGAGHAAAARPHAGFARLVRIGGGRMIYLTCRGTGSPTVVLVSGAGGASDEWMYAAPPGHQVGQVVVKDLRRSGSAVFPQVAASTRVCAYDRPNTTSVHGRPTASTAVPQPTTAAAGAADLEAVLTAAKVAPPYILVGASWGGMIVNLFARSHPAQVRGLVFVDAASEFLRTSLTGAQWLKDIQRVLALRPTGNETPDYQASTQQIRAAGQMPRVPAVVLTASQPWSLLAGTNFPSTWPAWQAAQDRLAELLHAVHRTNTRSGHVIAIERPAVVVSAVRQVLAKSRAAP